MKTLSFFIIVYIFVFVLLSIFKKEQFFNNDFYTLTSPQRGSNSIFYPYGNYSECQEYCKNIHPGIQYYNLDSSWKKLIDDECKKACSLQDGAPSINPANSGGQGVFDLDINSTKIIDENVQKILLNWKKPDPRNYNNYSYFGIYYYDSNLRNIDNMNVIYLPEADYPSKKFRIKDGYTEYTDQDEYYLEKNKKYIFKILLLDDNYNMISNHNKIIDNETEVIV